MDHNTLQVVEFLSKHISYITPFNGDKFSLSGFISRVEAFLPTMETLTPQYKSVILGIICDKVVGKARENLLKQGTITSWAELKQALIRSHGERTPITDIMDELKFCRCDSSIDHFYNKVSSILCKLNNAYILRGEGTAEQIADNQRVVLKHLIENLPPLAKNLVGCHDPVDLDEAFDLLNKFGYLSISNKSYFVQGKHNNSNNSKNLSNFKRNGDNYNSSNH